GCGCPYLHGHVCVRVPALVPPPDHPPARRVCFRGVCACDDLLVPLFPPPRNGESWPAVCLYHRSRTLVFWLHGLFYCGLPDRTGKRAHAPAPPVALPCTLPCHPVDRDRRIRLHAPDRDAACPVPRSGAADHGDDRPRVLPVSPALDRDLRAVPCRDAVRPARDAPCLLHLLDHSPARGRGRDLRV